MVILTTMLALLAGFLGFNIWVHSTKICVRDADALIILGYKSDGHVPHPLMQERLSAALHVLGHASFKRIICSGGAVGGELAEALLMKKYLVAHGVDEQHIILEDASWDTVENVAYSHRIMQHYELKTAVVISNSFHLRRISMICNRLGLNACYYGSRTISTVIRQLPNTLNEIKAFWATRRKLKEGLRVQF